VRLAGEVDEQHQRADNARELPCRPGDELLVPAGLVADRAVVEADEVLPTPPGPPHPVVVLEGHRRRQPPGLPQLQVPGVELGERLR
jgi:hypothetical protein